MFSHVSCVCVFMCLCTRVLCVCVCMCFVCEHVCFVCVFAHVYCVCVGVCVCECLRVHLFCLSAYVSFGVRVFVLCACDLLIYFVCLCCCCIVCCIVCFSVWEDRFWSLEASVLNFRARPTSWQCSFGELLIFRQHSPLKYLAFP